MARRVRTVHAGAMSVFAPAQRAAVAALTLLSAACGAPSEDPWLSEALERHRSEIAARSAAGNRAAAERLIVPLAESVGAEDHRRTQALALELQLLLEALNGRVEGVTTEPATPPGGMRHVRRSGLDDRLRTAIAGRSAEENLRIARSRVQALRTALASGSLGRARDLALELRLVAASSERARSG